MLACIVRKLLKKVLIVHACLLLTAGRNFWRRKKLCFNCTGPKHRAAEYVSKMSWELCSRRHHTSICNDQRLKAESVCLVLAMTRSVIYPVVVVKVGGIECRAVLDSSASAKLLDLLGKQPTEIKPKKIEMLTAPATARKQIFKTTVSSRSGDYSLDVSLTKVNQGELLSLENLRYEQCIKTYSHLRGVEIDVFLYFFISLFIYLFVCLFVYLFIYL